MARIEGQVTQESMTSAVSAERAAPTGAAQMMTVADSNNVEAMTAACQAMVQAHPGE